MLYPTETLDLLPPDAQIDAHLKHQKGIFRPRAVKKREKASEIAFRSQKLMAGAEGLEPSARGFGVSTRSFYIAFFSHFLH